MKRSKSIVLTTVMAAGGLSLAGCDSPATPSNAYLNPPAAVSQAQVVGEKSYPDLQACKDADEVSNAECATAFTEAESKSPRFADRDTCEERYGVDQCVPRSQAGGGSFFTPLLTGFLVGQALNNIGNRGYYGNQFPDRYGGGFSGGGYDRRYGGGREYVSGRDGYSAPARVQSRSSVISRGGFGGGGGRSFGG